MRNGSFVSIAEGVETPPAAEWRGSFSGVGLAVTAEEGHFLAHTDELDIDGRGLNYLSLKTSRGSRRRDGRRAVEGLGRGSAEAGVRSVVDVVVEGDGGSRLEVLEREGRNDLQEADALERLPEALEASVGIKVLDGSEAVLCAGAMDGLEEDVRDELAAEIRDEKGWCSEGVDRLLEQQGHVASAGRSVEGHRDERHSRVRVEYGGEMEGLRVEEVLDFGDVHHPDVIDEMRLDGIDGDVSDPGWGWSDGRHRPLLAFDVADSLFADLPARGEKVLGDKDIPTKAKGDHSLNEVPYPVVESADGRFGRCETNGLRLRVLTLLPRTDGVLADEEVPSGLDQIPSRSS